MDSDDALLPVRRQDPRKIGPYRVVGWLGKGGMGVVYAAPHAGTAAAVLLTGSEYAAEALSLIHRATVTIKKIDEDFFTTG